MVILGCELLPVLSGFIKLMTLNEGYDQVDFHESFLVCSEVWVGQQLLRNPLSELVPVQVANELLEVVLVDLVRFLERVHVQLDEVLVF